MDYYKLFKLEKEPFSNTPDPDFFYRTVVHSKCLMDLEIALRLRRGLCIVQGEVGTGKTTLCRQLIRVLADEEGISIYLVLDPGFDDAARFAAALNEMLSGAEKAGSCSTLGEHREMIKQFLYEAGVDLGRNVVLIIDEAQKLPGECIEFLRELLNYETNAHKLLQIVLFAQNEIAALLDAHPNFADRVALYYRLAPLDRNEAAGLIRFRLQKAGAGAGGDAEPVFTAGSIARIHRLTGGYPRKMVHLAHQILLLLLVKGRTRVTPAIVDQAARSVPAIKAPQRPFFRRPVFSVAAGAILAAVVLAGFAHFSLQNGSAPAVLPDRAPEAVSAAQPENPAEHMHKALSDPVAAPVSRFDDRPENALTDKNTSVPPPDYLGSLRIRNNEMLWRILEGIYGNSSVDIVRQVKDANPGMHNPDIIRPGQVVVLPVINKRLLHPEECCWIAFKQTSDLEQAYRFLAAMPVQDIRLASFWNPSGPDIVHAVVMPVPFSDGNRAADVLNRISGDLRSTARVLSVHDPGVYLVNLDQ